jgi:hypothetical protein
MGIEESKMHGLGTPEDLSRFLARRRTETTIVELHESHTEHDLEEEYNKNPRYV